MSTPRQRQVADFLARMDRAERGVPSAQGQVLPRVAALLDGKIKLLTDDITPVLVHSEPEPWEETLADFVADLNPRSLEWPIAAIGSPLTSKTLVRASGETVFDAADPTFVAIHAPRPVVAMLIVAAPAGYGDWKRHYILACNHLPEFNATGGDVTCCFDNGADKIVRYTDPTGVIC